MLVALDIGNSSINIGFFTESGLTVQNIDTFPLLSPSEYLGLFNRFIKEKNIDKIPKGIIISSVVPEHTDVLKKSLAGLTSVKPLLVSYKIKTGIKFDIPEPEKLGSDRIANVVAAYELFKAPVAAVDFGTATTISVVGKNANYIGGVILPGIGLMKESLADGTSKLPNVSLTPPEAALGIDTMRCIQAGLFYGTAGAVERLLKETEKETGFKLKVVLTGGYGGMISKFLKRRHVLKPYLTLEGLRILYKRNLDE
ncbi:MAG: type III pantothenate kinase [Nitrospirota bacterium]